MPRDKLQLQDLASQVGMCSNYGAPVMSNKMVMRPVHAASMDCVARYG